MNDRILALDVGDSRIGVAICDPLRSYALPLTTINRPRTKKTGDKQAIDKLNQLIAEKKPKIVIIGLPLAIDGSETKQSQKTRKFVEVFKKNTDLEKIKIIFWDERFSSLEADQSLQGSGLKNSDRRTARDKIAAAVILNSYLQSKSHNGNQ